MFQYWEVQTISTNHIAKNAAQLSLLFFVAVWYHISPVGKFDCTVVYTLDIIFHPGRCDLILSFSANDSCRYVIEIKFPYGQFLHKKFMHLYDRRIENNSQLRESALDLKTRD